MDYYAAIFRKRDLHQQTHVKEKCFGVWRSVREFHVYNLNLWDSILWKYLFNFHTKTHLTTRRLVLQRGDSCLGSRCRKLTFHIHKLFILDVLLYLNWNNCSLKSDINCIYPKTLWKSHSMYTRGCFMMSSQYNLF